MSKKFKAGLIVSTRAALGLGVDLGHYLQRHLRGDWGDLSAEDKQANDDALKDGTRLLSAYHTPQGKIWILTEANRACTTILLPEDY